MRKLVTFVAGASIAAATGCGSGGHPGGPPPPPFYRPAVELRDVRVGGVGLTGGSLEVHLAVYNPNAYDLRSPRFTYRVKVDDVTIGRGEYDADVVIPAADSAAVQLPVSFSYAGLGRAGRALLSTGSVNYRVVGDLVVDTPYGTLEAPYDRAGWFSSLKALSTIPKR